jgi:hypothetical protein
VWFDGEGSRIQARRLTSPRHSCTSFKREGSIDCQFSLWSLGLAGASSETVLVRQQRYYIPASEARELVERLQLQQKAPNGSSAGPAKNHVVRASEPPRGFTHLHLPGASRKFSPATTTSAVRQRVTAARRPVLFASPTIRSMECLVAALPARTHFRSPAVGSVLGCEDRTLSTAEARSHPLTIVPGSPGKSGSNDRGENTRHRR